MSRLTIGLPVYNGENFLRNALDSLLAQTFTDFRLIISDNASTDRTKEIAAEYVSKDPRITYLRHERNIGAARNHNLLLEFSQGEYFKWAHHDDVCAPEYLERCIEVLDREPSAVICHPRTIIIDQNGDPVRPIDDLLDFQSPHPNERLRAYLFRSAGMWNAVLGVIRTAQLTTTSLHGNYLGSDKILLAELILRGKIHQIPERFFFRRRHPQQAWRANSTKKALAAWFDPANEGKIILPPDYRLFIEYLRAIRLAPLNSSERAWCYYYTFLWGAKALLPNSMKSRIKSILGFKRQAGRISLPLKR